MFNPSSEWRNLSIKWAGKHGGKCGILGNDLELGGGLQTKVEFYTLVHVYQGEPGFCGCRALTSGEIPVCKPVYILREVKVLENVIQINISA